VGDWSQWAAAPRSIGSIRGAIEEQSMRIDELEEQFKRELRRVQMLQAQSEPGPSLYE
jgi:hypothetical protein